MHLYETHLPVTNTEIAKDFYTEIVGLTFAYRDPGRDIVFLWADSKDKGMIGLGGRTRLTAKETELRENATWPLPFRSINCSPPLQV